MMTLPLATRTRPPLEPSLISKEIPLSLILVTLIHLVLLAHLYGYVTAQFALMTLL